MFPFCISAKIYSIARDNQPDADFGSVLCIPFGIRITHRVKIPRPVTNEARFRHTHTHTHTQPHTHRHTHTCFFLLSVSGLLEQQSPLPLAVTFSPISKNFVAKNTFGYVLFGGTDHERCWRNYPVPACTAARYTVSVGR